METNRLRMISEERLADVLLRIDEAEKEIEKRNLAGLLENDLSPLGNELDVLRDEARRLAERQRLEDEL